MSEDALSAPRATDERLLEVAVGAARAAAAIHRDAAGRSDPSAWSEKGTSDFVTEVDREAERVIVARIREAFPTHRVVAEESTETESAGEEPPAASGRGGTPPVWIVDPLDGTTNWLHGYPAHAVSIAVADEGGLRAGVVLNSATDEEFVATRGGGARRDGAPIRVSDVTELSLALLGTGFPFKRAELIPDYLRVLGSMLRTTSGVRRAGAAALDLCDVACGRLDGFWEHWLMPWDVAAGALILMEAGGTFEALPAGAEPSLARAVAGGKALSSAFAGRSPYGATGPGAFLAANATLSGPLREVLARELAGG